MSNEMTYRIDGDCWIWTGKVRSNGTPTLPGKKKINPRYIMFEEHFGAVPEGMFVISSCGNRLCVSPEHLTLSQSKGRAAKFASLPERKRAYYERNKEVKNRYSKDYYEKNKEKYIAMTAARKKKYRANAAQEPF